jgi:ABC-type polysaccharide/polyol phosphate export permease
VTGPAAGFELRGESSSLGALLADIWASRELLRILARKDFFVRYRRASFGVLWAVGLPVLQAAVLGVVFTQVIRIHAGTNYPTFVFAGLLPWTFFSATITGAATSIVDGQDLATKIYFPRAIFPLVVIGANLYGFLPSVVILYVFALGFGAHVGVNVVLIVPAVVLMLALTTSFSLMVAPLHVYFRDVRYVMTAAVLVWFYATPVIYPLSRAHGWVRAMIIANPATGMVELFRAASAGVDHGWPVALWSTIGWTVAFSVAAALLHRRYDRVFVDLL